MLVMLKSEGEQACLRAAFESSMDGRADESGPLPHELLGLLLGYDLGWPAWSAALKVCALSLFQRAGQKIVTVGRRAQNWAQTMTFAGPAEREDQLAGWLDGWLARWLAGLFTRWALPWASWKTPVQRSKKCAKSREEMLHSDVSMQGAV